MKRTAIAMEKGQEVGEVTCENYGHTIDTREVWWNPETKKKYLYHELDDFVYFEEYEGPVIHGSVYSF